MFSSWLGKIILPPFLVVGLCSCLPVGDKPADTPKTETKIGEEAKCLTGLMPTLLSFVKGEAETERVVRLWGCFDDALGLFERRVRGGQDPQSFTARELATFFEDYFLDDDIKINDRLLVEVMRFKQLVVGGENARMTRPELSRLREFARFMKEESRILNPQMKILAMSWAVSGKDHFNEDFATFEAAKTVALKVIEDLAAWIEPNGQTYRIENFVVFLKELQALAKSEWRATAEIERLTPLLRKLKGTLTGTEESVIAPTDWRKFGRLGSRAYFQYLRYYYFFEKNPHRDDDPELLLVFRSLDDLFSVVSDVLQEKTGRKLVRQEILGVMDAVTKVFPNFKVSPALLDSVLKLKALFLGGTVSELTPEDLARGRAKLDPFRQLTNLFLKNSLVFETKWDPASLPADEAREFFAGAEKDLMTMAGLLAPLFESDYDLEALVGLVRSFEESFAPVGSGPTKTERLEKLMPFLLAGKEAILDSPGPVVAQADFPFLMDVLARGAARTLDYYYFYRGASLLRNPEKFEELLTPIQDFSESLFRARGRGTPKILSMDNLRSLLGHLDRAGVLQGLYSKTNLEMLLPVLIERFLPSGSERLKGTAERGIGPKGIENLLAEIRLWMGVQKNLNLALASQPRLMHTELVAKFSKSTEIGDREFLRLIQSPMPLAFDSENRLYINTSSEVPYTERSIDILNLVRAGLRAAIRGYGADNSQVQELAGLTQAQFTKIFRDIRPLAVQMEWIAADNHSFDTSRFMEGNLFTGFSDGNDFLNYGEAGSLAVMIVSGLKLHSMWKADIVTACNVPGTTVPSVMADCAVDVIRRRAPEVLASMPKMVELLQGNEKEVRGFLIQVLKSAGWSASEDGVAPLSDVALMPHVLQYIESLFRRWDTDGNGTLNTEEAMRAEVMFRPLIKKVSQLEEENWLRAVFAYILVKGKPPETYWEKFQFSTGWVDADDTWDIKADRVRIGQILGFIADSVRNKVTLQIREERE